MTPKCFKRLLPCFEEPGFKQVPAFLGRIENTHDEEIVVEIPRSAGRSGVRTGPQMPGETIAQIWEASL